jgi:glycosyltransferase involved in cell wall biosynthesis
MRICIVYDCLFPHTVGGAERWYRNLAERLADSGHDVTYLTLRQWDRAARPEIDPRVRVVAVGPRMSLYTASRRRRIAPPLVFGLGVLVHLLLNGRRYEVVHTASFPYFSLLGAGAARRRGRFSLVVDWHEVWSRAYWRDYLGRVGGAIGYAVQHACVRLDQRAFCFSRLHAERLRSEGLRGPVTVLEGEYGGSLEPPTVRQAEDRVVFAARMIPEKRAPLAVESVIAARERIPGLRAVLFGDGPERDEVLEAIARAGAKGMIEAPGFVDSGEVDTALSRALCMLLTSSREGYGLIVVEAAARGTPSIVVAGEDNAATELIAEGVNGTIAARAEPAVIAEAIVGVYEAGPALRNSTARWFMENRERLSLDHSLSVVLDTYASARA